MKGNVLLQYRCVHVQLHNIGNAGHSGALCDGSTALLVGVCIQIGTEDNGWVHMHMCAHMSITKTG